MRKNHVSMFVSKVYACTLYTHVYLCCWLLKLLKLSIFASDTVHFFHYYCLIKCVCLCTTFVVKKNIRRTTPFVYKIRCFFFFCAHAHLSSLYLCLLEIHAFLCGKSFIKLALHDSHSLIRCSDRMVFAYHSYTIKSVGRSVGRLLSRVSWYNSVFEWFVTQ